jgi:hypothetical protein
MGGYYGGWVTQSRRVKTCASGTCTRCGAKLSIYRTGNEIYCAPCSAVLTRY